MMEKQYLSEDICIRLVKSSLWGCHVEVPESFDDWSNVLRIARKQSVLPAVGNRMLADPRIAETLSSGLQTKIRSFVMGNMLMHQKINRALLTAKERLENHGVPPVLLKGQGVACNYPDPYLRQCGDIDFFVGEAKYEAAYEVFQEFASEIDDRKNIYHGKHFHAFLGKIEFDVHRFCGQYFLRGYNRKFQEESLKGLTVGLDHFTVNDVPVLVPAKEFNAYYIFNHLFNHFQLSGIGLRHLCDLMMFLHANHGRLDLSELKRILSRMDMMHPWKLFGGVLVDVLGMPSEEFPFYEKISARKVNRIIRHIWDEGNFGFETDYYSRNAKNGFFRIFLSLKFHAVRFLRLFLLMPGASVRRMANYLVFGVGHFFRK